MNEQPLDEQSMGQPLAVLGKLAEALAKAQGSFEAIGKDKTAKVQRKDGGASYTYKYADLADVLASVRKALSANGLAVVQRIVRANSELLLETRLLHTAGGYITSEYPLPSSAGRPQEMGSAITYARRYSLCSLLGISPDEDDDGAGAQRGHDDHDDEPDHDHTLPWPPQRTAPQPARAPEQQTLAPAPCPKCGKPGRPSKYPKAGKTHFCSTCTESVNGRDSQFMFAPAAQGQPQ